MINLSFKIAYEFRTLLRLNSLIHNFILAIGLVTLGVIAVDVQTELSIEREEINILIAELSESETQVEFSTDLLDLPVSNKVSYFLSDENLKFQHLLSSGMCRAPPYSVNFILI